MSRAPKSTATSKPVSKAYLERAAIYYLERYSSSAKNLERVLIRKIRRRNENHAEPSSDQLEWVGEVCQKCAHLGYVDDSRYARMRASSMHRAGKPDRTIKLDLRHKGVSEQNITEALQYLKDEEGQNTDRLAAVTYARRRRFGPFRTKEGDETKMQKEIASMARAGFKYDDVKKVVQAESVEALNEWLEEYHED